MANIKIALINEYPGLTAAEVQTAVRALRIQVSRDFAPVWGIDADLDFYPTVQAAPPDAWQLVIFDDSDQAGALGYHDVTATGQPLGKIFAGTDKKYNSAWTVTTSHELLEMLGDPDVNLCALVQEDEASAGTLFAYEVCDACEADQYGYNISVDGQDILVSDFVYPSWFETFHAAGTQYDFQNKITQAFQLLTGGYIGVFEISQGSGWTQRFANNTPPSYQARAHVGSRRERRRILRDHWLTSNPHQSGRPARTLSPLRSFAAAAAVAPAQGAPATVSVVFLGGQGDATVTLTRVDNSTEVKTLPTGGGSVTFSNVQTGDLINVGGNTTSKDGATITIDRTTHPPTPLSVKKEGPFAFTFSVTA
jgi:hypothetical protein